MGKDGTSHATSHMDVNAQGQLEFCECALVTGSVVTCVGEITRDRNGGLSLYPWRPAAIAPAKEAAKQAAKEAARQCNLGGPWLGVAMPLVTPSFSDGGSSEEKEPWEALAGHVWISDDPALFME